MAPPKKGESGPAVSIIVPTYREAENIPHLVERVANVAREAGLDVEMLIMDDRSEDGTVESVAALDDGDWVRLVTRDGPRGLSPAVLDGMRLARGDAFVVMDADLSHPPEKIPDMLAALDGGGADFAVGSRYVQGASTDQDWGLFRLLNSRIATLLARPLVKVQDPMSGFFALRRETFAAAEALNPIGYKIGLELMVKCGCREVREIPIHFADRTRGESKLSLREQILYLRHLKRLFDFKFGSLAQFAQFATVGASGVVVNLAVLTLALALHVHVRVAVALAIAVSMTTNFILNRTVTFAATRRRSPVRQFPAFVAVCAVGALVNYGVTIATVGMHPVFERVPQLAALVGIACGTVFNFAGGKLLVFHDRPGPPDG